MEELAFKRVKDTSLGTEVVASCMGEEFI